jgi:hypothetical protein
MLMTDDTGWNDFGCYSEEAQLQDAGNRTRDAPAAVNANALHSIVAGAKVFFRICAHESGRLEFPFTSALV